MNDELKPVTRRAFRPIFRWHPPTGVVYWQDQIIWAPNKPGIVDRFRAEQRQEKLAWLNKDPRGKFRRS